MSRAVDGRTDGWRDRDGWEVPTDPGRRLFGALNFEPFDREVRIAGRKKKGGGNTAHRVQQHPLNDVAHVDL